MFHRIDDMIQKIYIFLILIFAQEIYAGFLGSLGACITDPCNCYCPSVKEVWQTNAGIVAGDPTQTYTKTYTSNCNCPPYNKFNFSLPPGGGSKTSKRPGCLKGSGIPGRFETYDYQCAEAVKDNYFFDYASSFKPKIKVRSYGCFGACWVQTKILNYDGECNYFASGNLPLVPIRICARVALHGSDGEPDDYGYMYINNDSTKPGHLTSKGYYEIDPLYNITEITEANDGTQTSQNVSYRIFPPKICAYNDPDLFITFLKSGGAIGQIIQTIQNVANGDPPAPDIDYLDWNPTRQQLHKTTAGSPIISLIIFLFKNAINMVEMLGGLIEKVAKGMNLDFLAKLTEYILKGIDFLGESVFVPILEALNSMNRIVGDSLGCVNVPLGPPPPPYCSTISDNYQMVSMHNICRTNHDGSLEFSTLNTQCHISQKANKYLSPTLRASFDNLISICPANSPISDGCVIFSGITTPLMAHSLFNGLDLIPKCSATVTTGCVNSTLPTSVNWVYNGVLYSGYRLVYGFMSSGVKTILDAYIYPDIAGSTSYPNCSSVLSNDCLFVYGINSGSFKDINMSFPSVELTYNNSDLTQSDSLTFNSQNTNLLAKVIRVESDNTTQNINELCLYDVTAGSSLIDCQERLMAPKPYIYSCGSSSSRVACTSSHFMPKAVVSVESAGLSSQGVVVAPLAPNIDAVNVNLGGNDYGSFVTNDDLLTMPYDTANDPKAYGANSRYGNYVDDANPLTDNTAQYLSGLEYDIGYYVVGGTQMCLSGYPYEKCSILSPKNCVLTNLVNGAPSMDISDRIIPDDSLGPILSDNQYFNYGVDLINTSTQTVRDKTPIEMNLCASVPAPPPCSAITSSTSGVNDGGATWPQTLPDDNVNGTCLEGMVSINPSGPQRPCFLDKNLKLSVYKDVVDGTECKSAMNLSSTQKWQKIPLSVTNGVTYSFSFAGEVSLCRAYIPENNTQQYSPYNILGVLTPLPRVNDVSSYGIPLLFSPRSLNIKNLASLYEGDKISILVGRTYFHLYSVAFFNFFNFTTNFYNCLNTSTDIHPVCGRFSIWNDYSYKKSPSRWEINGAGLSMWCNATNINPTIRSFDNSDKDAYSYSSLTTTAPGYYGPFSVFYRNNAFPMTGNLGLYRYDNEYSDNIGGYVFYVKQTKCVRKNGQAKTDPGMYNRGQIKLYLTSGNEDPNLTNGVGSNLSVDASGNATYTPYATGSLWLKIDNLSTDYANSSGSYSVNIGIVE